MKIAIDGRCLQGHRRGMGVYTHSLLVAMVRQHHAHRITVLLDRSLPVPSPAVPERHDIQYVRGGGAVAWEQFWLPRAARPFELLHAPANGCPWSVSCPVVVTLHDAIFIRGWRDISAIPYPRQIMGHWYRTWVHPAAARRARAVLTVSEASKGDIARLLRIPKDRITVTHEALTESFHQCAAMPEDRVRAAFGLTGRYLLAMGAYEKRKNIPLLFQVMDKLRSAEGACPILVLVGAENLSATRYLSEVSERGIGPVVKFLPYVAEPELKGLYRGATAFLWPSRQEGFGLPLLEAMSCGTPVIASDIPVHREIAGDAAQFVSPDDPTGWKSAVDGLLQDEGRRVTLRTQGLARVEEFSWDRLAQQTMTVYERAIG